jgi:hypothetical protein
MFKEREERNKGGSERHYIGGGKVEKVKLSL